MQQSNLSMEKKVEMYHIIVVPTMLYDYEDFKYCMQRIHNMTLTSVKLPKL